MVASPTNWEVLLIGGSSGVGKTTVARRIGRQLGRSVVHVDDLRLAFQHSRVHLPDAAGTAALYFFWDAPDVWQRPPAELRDALIAVGAALAPAIEIVVANHIDQAEMGPIVIEGDNIVPALVARPMIHELATSGRVRGLFLVEPDEGTLLANSMARGRHGFGQTEAEQRTEARAHWLYGQWLADEALRWRMPVLEPRPSETLDERVMAAIATAEHW
jgi:2-phosphoglycerate kinase